MGRMGKRRTRPLGPPAASRFLHNIYVTPAFRVNHAALSGVRHAVRTQNDRSTMGHPSDSQCAGGGSGPDNTLCLRRAGPALTQARAAATEQSESRPHLSAGDGRVAVPALYGQVSRSHSVDARARR